MSKDPLDVRRIGFYYSVAQVGLEMAVPPAIGMWIDSFFPGQHWGVIVGGMLGLAIGIIHLTALMNQSRQREDNTPRSEQDQK
jgi:F0F1-type ATP synthase assembly protein I